MQDFTSMTDNEALYGIFGTDEEWDITTARWDQELVWIDCMMLTETTKIH